MAKKFLKIFDNYDDFKMKQGSVMAYPNIVLFRDNEELLFNKPYEEQYFTIQVLEDGNFTVDIPTTSTSFKYRLNGGDWTSNAGGLSKSLNAFDILEISCVCDKFAEYAFDATSIKFNAYGNIMSLLYGDKFIGQTDLTGKDNAFYRLFQNCTTLQSTENLILPATTLAESCYYYMFHGCTSLTTAPELPATTLAQSCYYNMFYGCTSLTTAPSILPATELADYCYQYMFNGCTSLATVPELPATTLAEECYQYMFQGCTSLETTPELPATTLTDYCYSNMFNGCTGLTTAPELPAKELAKYCYRYMFSNCTSLTEAPELPATELEWTCYRSMFEGCTSLTTAPELPATTLTRQCYQSMFAGCTNLNYIKMLATDISASLCLNKWVDGVSDVGVFIKAQDVEIPSGSNGIPEDWTVEEYVEQLNGYEYVDLGLPSGTLWAKCNVGASKPEESGLYFAWGNTVGYTADDVRNGNHVFNSENDVLNGKDDPYSEGIKYNSTDGLITLLPEDDAATVNMGGDWHMPTKEQLEELTANTTSTWTTMNGVNGRLFKSKINGNELFIPAAGCCNNGSVNSEGSTAYVWGSSLPVEYTNNAWYLYFYSSGVSISYYSLRYVGYSVRGVIENNK